MSEGTTPPTHRTQKRRGAPVIARVLDLTLEELARSGFHGLSIPDIAARASLNKTSVYRRWPTRAALVSAALEHAMGHDGPLPDTGNLRSDMLAFTHAAAAWADSAIGRAVLRTLLLDRSDPEVGALVQTMLQPQTTGPMALFERARDRGELSATADIPLVMTVIAGAMLQRLLVENLAITTDFVERLVGLVLNELVGPHSAWLSAGRVVPATANKPRNP